MHCLNLEAYLVASVLQVGAALPVKFNHIVDRDGGGFTARILALAQPNCWRRDGSVKLLSSEVL